MKMLQRILLAFALALLPAATLAFDLPFEVENVPNPEHFEDPRFSGLQDAGARVLASGTLMTVDILKKVVSFVFVVILVWFGLQMTVAGGDEDLVKKNKTGIVWLLISLCLLLIVQPMITNVLFGGGENFRPGDVLKDAQSMALSIDTGTQQIFAILQWGKALVVTGALIYLIFSGAQMILSLGDEETLKKQRQAILWIGVGFLAIAFNEVIINEVIFSRMFKLDETKVYFLQNSVRGIQEIVAVIKFILKFAAVIAFSVFVIGGGNFIFSFGNDERIELGKKMIFDAAIGLVVILISFVLVSTLVTGDL